MRNVMEMFANLKINLGEGDNLRSRFDEMVTASDVDRWFDVESDDGLGDALISDSVDEIEELTIETREQEAEENEGEGEGIEVTASTPSLQQFYAMFHPIQESASCVTFLMRVVTFAEGGNSPAQRQLLIAEKLTNRS